MSKAVPSPGYESGKETEGKPAVSFGGNGNSLLVEQRVTSARLGGTQCVSEHAQVPYGAFALLSQVYRGKEREGF